MRIRLTHVVPTPMSSLPEGLELDGEGFAAELIVETTLGRALFNETLPEDYPYVNDQVDKKRLSTIVNDLAERYSKVQVAASLDALKEYGFHWATRSGTTVAISDVVTPPRKLEILEGYEEKATKVQTQYERGLITDDERRQGSSRSGPRRRTRSPRRWRRTSRGRTPSTGWSRRVLAVTGCSCARSPACVGWCRTRRATSSRDRSARTSARACPCSSSSSPRTARARVWRTPRCGPPTRATSPVASSTCRQDVIIREDDCGTDRGLPMPIASVDERTGTRSVHDDVETSVYARTLAEDVVQDGEVLAEAGIDLGDVVIDALIAAGVD